MAEEFKYIGKAIQRKDAIGKVTGQAKYTVDLRFPGMLHMRFLRSPHAHANITHIDTSAAKRIPGVLDVLTYEDVMTQYGYIPVEVGGLPIFALLDRRVRYVGDLVAAVVGQDPYAAEEALGHIHVEYELLPAVFDVDSALAPGAPLLHPERETNIDPEQDPTSNVVPTRMITSMSVGDIEQGFKEADLIVENTFVYDAHQPHICLEPHCSVVVPQGDQLTIYLSGQSLWSPANAYTQLFGPNVNLILPIAGGAFGSKHDAQRENCLAAVVAKKTGMPVANLPTREEEYICYLHRCGMKSTWKLGVKKDGTITALDCHNYTDCGAYNFGVRVACAQAVISSEMITKCPNQRYEIIPVYMNTSPGGAYRGYGFFEGCFALGSAILKLAEQLDMDPLDIFMKNGVQPGDKHLDYQIGEEKTVTTGDLPIILRKGADMFGWKDKWKGWHTPMSVEGSKRSGVGFGVCVAPRGGMGAAVSVMLNANGTAKIFAAVSEIGQGTQSALCNMAAELLNMSVESVSFSEVSMNGTPYTAVGQAESRSLVDFGNAMCNAIDDAKRQLFAIGAETLHVRPEDLDTRDGVVFVKDNPEVAIPWLFLFGFTASCMIGRGDNRKHVDDLLFPHAVPFSFYELTVDTETGELTIPHWLGGVDAGRQINPYGLLAMYEGGNLQGQAFVLRERLYMDRSTGKVLNGNMIFCGGASILDRPALMDIYLPENELDPLTPFGAKGEGEGSNSPAWGLILAFHNATGKWVDKLPMTPKEVLEMLGKA
ncbi:MAG: xanthine dehydrogenase family protein molybdopterin-binding subunit [Clostridiales Family XIII bacterium]|nr:xanthine dehydrogenase family protein molybdopterin-binding subunit [Clostridiales Family XIII bacterium]